MQQGSHVAFAAFFLASLEHLTTVARSLSAGELSLDLLTEAPLFSEIDRLAVQSRAVKSQMCSRPFDRRQMQIFPGSFPSISFTTRSLQKKSSFCRLPLWFDTRTDLWFRLGRGFHVTAKALGEQMVFPVSLSLSLQFVLMTAGCA